MISIVSRAACSLRRHNSAWNDWWMAEMREVGSTEVVLKKIETHLGHYHALELFAPRKSSTSSGFVSY